MPRRAPGQLSLLQQAAIAAAVTKATEPLRAQVSDLVDRADAMVAEIESLRASVQELTAATRPAPSPAAEPAAARPRLRLFGRRPVQA